MLSDYEIMNGGRKMQDRWKSKILWTTIIAQVASILLLTGAIDIQTSEIIQQVTGLILQILVVVGIVNNPTNGEGW